MSIVPSESVVGGADRKFDQPGRAYLGLGVMRVRAVRAPPVGGHGGHENRQPETTSTEEEPR